MYEMVDKEYIRKNSLARESSNSNLTMTQFLSLYLANRLHMYLQQAKFPVAKTLQEFDFTAIPHLPKQRNLSLADGQFLREKQKLGLHGRLRNRHADRYEKGSLLITTNLEFGR